MNAAVIVSIRIAASPQECFDAFVDDIALWWKPNGLFQLTPRGDGALRFEPGENGRLVTTLSNGHIFEIGRITAWEPGRRLAFTWRQATFASGQMTQVEVRFDGVGERTRVTVIHDGWETVPDAHVAKHGMTGVHYLQRHGGWWLALLAGLSARLAQA